MLAGEIHSCDAIAIGAVAQRTLRAVEAKSGLDIGRVVLVILDLRDGRPGVGRNAQQPRTEWQTDHPDDETQEPHGKILRERSVSGQG